MKFNIWRNSIKKATGLMIMLVLLGLATLTSSGVSAETLYLVRPHSGIEIIDSEDPAYHMGPHNKSGSTKGSEGVVDFTIEYQDSANQGFNDAALGSERKARLEDAIRYVLSVINIQSPTALEILVKPSVSSGGTGFLATAGPLFGNSEISNGGAFTRLMTGSKPFPDEAEIILTVDFSHNWNTTSGPPAFNEADFVSVLVHELTHGLGILSLGQADGTSQLPGTITVWDSLVVLGSTSQPIFSGSPPTDIIALLTSNDLAFEGNNAVALYDQLGAQPPVYSPSPFESGSSLSHWDRNALAGNAVMTQSITVGSPTRRVFAPVDLGALLDLGYDGVVAVEGVPFISVFPSDSSRDFGAVEVGNSVVASWTVTNDGESTLSGQVTSSNALFSVSGANAYALPSGETSAPLEVQFTPTADGAQSGTLTFTGGENGPITVSVSGSGMDPVVEEDDPRISVATGGNQSFGQIEEGMSSAPATWTISNSGTGTLFWSASTSNTVFRFGAAITANGTLVEGAPEQVSIIFTPSGAGSFIADLTFSNDSVGSTQADTTVQVNGTGVAIKGSSCSAQSGGSTGGRAGDLLVVGLALFGLMLRHRRVVALARRTG